jgi:hypothetical protein
MVICMKYVFSHSFKLAEYTLLALIEKIDYY